MRKIYKIRKFYRHLEREDPEKKRKGENGRQGRKEITSIRNEIQR